MRAIMWVALAAGAAVGCGGQTFTSTGSDGGTGSSSGGASSSGSGGGSGSGSGGSSSSGGGSGSGSSGASSSSGGSGSGGSSGASSSGGTSSSSGSGSGGSSGGGSGSSSGSGGSPCPPSADPGGSCSPDGLACEYGTNPDPSCNLIENCQGGHWSYPPPGVECPGGQCPTTYPDSNGSVSCTPDGFDCAYSQGQCNCSVGALTGNPADPHWWCSPATPGCPEPRAPLGTACTEEGLECDYGACTGGIAEQCTGGIWVQEFTACPEMAGAR